ncbi:MAG: DUF58 domain-containing protein [Candidatus Thiodiazotropha sp.]
MASLSLPARLLRFRRHARNDGHGGVVIRPRSLYIIPTRQGLLLALVLGLMLAGSINYGSNLGHLITFLLAGVWLSTILHTWRNLLGISLRAAQVTPVFAGQDAVFQVRISNHSRLARFGLTLRHKRFRGESTDLPAAETRLLHLSLPTQHRGLLRLPEITLQTIYPLGLFRAWSYAELDLCCLVYPQPATTGTPPVEANYTASEDGDRGVGADDFVGLRGYRLGDSPRHIDWKAFARQRGLLSKQFGGDRTERIELDWDLLPPVDTEQRLSLLCRFVLQAEGETRSYSLRIPGVVIEPGQGEQHKQRCLAALALYGGTA